MVPEYRSTSTPNNQYVETSLNNSYMIKDMPKSPIIADFHPTSNLNSLNDFKYIEKSPSIDNIDTENRPGYINVPVEGNQALQHTIGSSENTLNISDYR